MSSPMTMLDKVYAAKGRIFGVGLGPGDPELITMVAGAVGRMRKTPV